MPDSALDSIFKAYDVRGIYPDEIDESIARRIGNAFVAFTGSARVLVGRDARPSSEPLVAAFTEGALMAGADVVDLGAGVDRPLLLRRRQPRRAGGHVHRQPQPRPVQRREAVPGRRPAHRPGHRAGRDQGDGRRRAPRAGRRPGSGRVSATCCPRSSRTCTRSSTSTRWRRCASSPTPPTASAGVIAPAVFAGLPFELTLLFGELDGTFPNHPADPDQQPRT